MEQNNGADGIFVDRGKPVFTNQGGKIYEKTNYKHSAEPMLGTAFATDSAVDDYRSGHIGNERHVGR